MKTKILITGATGFIGSNLIRRLIETDAEIHILTRSNSNIWRISDIIEKAHNHPVDILEQSFLIGVHHGLTDKMIDYMFEVFYNFLIKI